MTGTRDRRVSIARIPPERRFLIAALRRQRHLAPMHGLLDVDVTEPLRRLSEATPKLSLTAYVIASVARAAALHPEVHAYRDWLGRLVTHHYVDVATLVEIQRPTGLLAMAHTVHEADVRTVREISDELHAVKADPSTSPTGKLIDRARWAMRIPGAAWFTHLLLARSKRTHRFSGTVAVSAVGMFAGGGGYAIGIPTELSLGITVGGLSVRPRWVNAQILPRDVLDLTVSIDHYVVDGAPAARFGADLRRILESGAALGP